MARGRTAKTTRNRHFREGYTSPQSSKDAAPPDVAKAVAWTNAGARSKERTDTKSQSRGASAPRGIDLLRGLDTAEVCDTLAPLGLVDSVDELHPTLRGRPRHELDSLYLSVEGAGGDGWAGGVA